ncbi:hypothetical protein D3C72_2029220 [compost metagenome]
MPRLHQAGRLQLGQRLAHDGAADIVAAHQFRLGGQLVAFTQQALADLGFKLFGQQVGQVAAAPVGLVAQGASVRAGKNCRRLG